MIKKLNIRAICRSWARRNLLTFNTLRYRVEFPRILEAFEKIGPQQLVLDGGAGGGQMLRMVFEHGYCSKGVGLEPDPELFRILKDNYEEVPALHPVSGSLLAIPMESETVDCAMTTQVLEHIDDDKLAASELGRVVKTNGFLIVSVPHPPEPFSSPGHVREGYLESDLINLFPSENYELLSTGYSMTRPTVRRAMLSSRLPMKGCFVPVAWADQETRLTNDQRKNQTPYGITCLFRKIH